MKYKLLLSLFFVLNQLVCYGEADTIPQLSEGIQFHYGFIIPHSKVIEPVSHTNPYGIEFTMSWLKTSAESWKVFNSYWISGFNAGYFSFQNPDILGGAFLLTGFAEPFIKYGKRYVISIRGGAGISYQTKIYDEDKNPLNQFFCTRLSFPLYLSTRFKYKLNQSTYLTISGCYNHISNGGVKQPNYGMNFPTFGLGLEYFPKPLPELSRKYHDDIKFKNPGVYLILQLLSCYKVIDKTDLYPEKASFAFGLHARIARQLNRSYALSAGAELILDYSIKETLKRENISSDYKRLAITAGQDFFFGNVTFTQHFGYYVYSPYRARNSIYQKYEIAYSINPDLLIGIYLKAHANAAELMGLNFSCMLFKR